MAVRKDADTLSVAEKAECVNAVLALKAEGSSDQFWISGDSIFSSKSHNRTGMKWVYRPPNSVRNGSRHKRIICERGETMVSKRSPKPEKKREVKAVEAAKVGGHAIIIRSVHEQKQESLQLLLDGKRVPFLETDDGYLVGYTQAKSLLEAAKLYAKRRFDVGRKKGGK